MEVVDGDKARVTRPCDCDPMVTPETHRLISELDRFKAPTCNERDCDRFVAKIVRPRKHLPAR
jgi:hypothetical protein